MSDLKYSAFLCYSHADSKWADWLHRELERYRIPKHLQARGGSALPRSFKPVFRDREELPTAHSLPELVEAALAQSEALIVICSPAAAQSNWVNNEISVFRRLGRGDRVLCLIVDGEPNSGDARECFPPALRERLPGRVDEPLAADVRPGQDGKARAKLKVIAGLLNVGLDDLAQRDLHRRHRRMVAVSLGSSLIAVVMAALAVFAIMSQNEAERRREDAEELVGFMVGDLRQKLNEVGRIDLFDAVADQATKYFKSLEGDDARDEVLAMRAETLRQIGRVRADQAKVTEAEQAFSEAKAISEMLVSNDPERYDWQIGLANDQFWLGFLHWQRGNLDAAREAFQAQLVLVDNVSASDPTNADWMSERMYAWTNYGRILEARGQLEEARSAYSRVMDIAEQLVQLEPENPEWQLELGFAHNNFGKLSIALGNLTEAYKHYALDLEIKKRVHESRPSQVLWHEYLGVSHYFMGHILQLQGQYEPAREQLLSARRTFEQLILYDDSATMPWRRRLAVIECALAKGYRLEGEPGRAREFIRPALEAFKELTDADPQNVPWQVEMGHCHVEEARIFIAEGAAQQGLEPAKEAEAVAQSVLAANAGNRDANELHAQALLVQGDIETLLGRPDTARSTWQSALAAVQQTFSATSDPVVLDLEATLLTRLGRVDAAEPLSARLRETGYRSPHGSPF